MGLIEILSLMYSYGHARFTDDIEEMTGIRPGLYWQLTWRFIAPLLLILILFMSIFKTFTTMPEYAAWIEENGNSEKKQFPAWSLGIGTILALASILPILFVALFRKLGITRPHVDYEAGSPLKRIETNASTAPMLRENSMATTHGFEYRDNSPERDSENGDEDEDQSNL